MDGLDDALAAIEQLEIQETTMKILAARYDQHMRNLGRGTPAARELAECRYDEFVNGLTPEEWKALLLRFYSYASFATNELRKLRGEQ